MPTLDRLAKKGLRYNNMHVTALCSPTRAALLTGRNHHTCNTGAVMDIAEVYLNGAGWRGYDPSQGLAVADRHVAVAAAAGPAEAAPTLGSFRGTNVASTMETLIVVKVPTFAESAYQPAGRIALSRVTGLRPAPD